MYHITTSSKSVFISWVENASQFSRSKSKHKNITLAHDLFLFIRMLRIPVSITVRTSLSHFKRVSKIFSDCLAPLQLFLNRRSCFWSALSTDVLTFYSRWEGVDQYNTSNTHRLCVCPLWCFFFLLLTFIYLNTHTHTSQNHAIYHLLNWK